MIGTHTDITELKNLNQSLKIEKESYYHTKACLGDKVNIRLPDWGLAAQIFVRRAIVQFQED